MKCTAARGRIATSPPNWCCAFSPPRRTGRGRPPPPTIRESSNSFSTTAPRCARSPRNSVSTGPPSGARSRPARSPATRAPTDASPTAASTGATAGFRRAVPRHARLCAALRLVQSVQRRLRGLRGAALRHARRQIPALNPRFHLRRGGHRQTRAAPHPAQRGDVHQQASGGQIARIVPSENTMSRGYMANKQQPPRLLQRLCLALSMR